MILPATSSHQVTISGAHSLAELKSQLPAGTTILTSGHGDSGQMVALLPGGSVMPVSRSSRSASVFCRCKLGRFSKPRQWDDK